MTVIFEQVYPRYNTLENVEFPFVSRTTTSAAVTTVAVIAKLADRCGIEYAIYFASGNALYTTSYKTIFSPSHVSEQASEAVPHHVEEQPLSRILKLQSRLTGQSVVNIQQTLSLRV